MRARATYTPAATSRPAASRPSQRNPPPRRRPASRWRTSLPSAAYTPIDGQPEATPTTLSDTQSRNGLGLAERCAAIEKGNEITSRFEATLNAPHQPAALLIGETVSFKDDCIVIVQRFGKMKIMFQTLNERFECL